MLVWRLMSLDRLLKLVSILFIFVIACTSNQQINTADSCIIFDQKKNWYKATKKSYDKWETPIALQLAIINQESSFNQFAKPERKKFLGIFPGSRPSTAFGYAQVTNPTWEWYKTKTGNNNASRANFSDVTDFIGWYTTQSKNIIGISKKDFYNQYLAYHEGQGGWKKKSYLKKKWLIEVAKNVERNAKMYNNQLKDCENSLNRKGFFGIF
ncbi:MAG: transglycosylase SLT domain-containing protein [Pelagibacteraceae bacterium]|nr:transglycosylase SLT domain-containing protein [Pelagibacteraceae bacterium]